MSLIKWTPRSTVPSPFAGDSALALNDIDHFISSFFNQSFDFTPTPGINWLPAFDIIERKRKYEVKVEAPGMEKSDFSVVVKDGVLTISGEKKADNSDEENGYTYRESLLGKFARSFRLPEGVNETKVGATYKNGVLTISIPRSKPVEIKKLEVEIK